MAQIAYLGTGLLGSAFAEAAAKRGDSVTVWNRTASKAKALEQFGITVAATPAEAVKGASRVYILLKDDAVVEEAIAAARAGLAKDAIIIDHTTTLPELTAKRVARLNGEGINYLHCPVFMGPPAARNAAGTILVSGPKALYETVTDALAKSTGKVQYFGEQGDLAAVNKLFGNAMLLGIGALLADIYTVGQGAGVRAEDALTLMGLFDLNAVINGRGKSMAAGNFAPSFELSMARKDIGLMIKTAGERPLAVLPGMASRMDTLIAAGHGAEDCGVLAIDAVKN
jgi:3-hydroxyisobutyrate dehydrogenase